jgi:Sec7-like guanine-nucleotide exchange factor
MGRFIYVIYIYQVFTPCIRGFGSNPGYPWVRTKMESGHFYRENDDKQTMDFPVSYSQTNPHCFGFCQPKLMVSPEKTTMDFDLNEPRKATAWATSSGCTTTATNWNCLTRPWPGLLWM